MAWVFTEIFRTRVHNAYKTKATTRKVAESAKAIRERQRELSKKPTVSGIRVSYFVTSQLEKGNPIMEATGIANKMLPNSASFKCKAAAIVGMREVQLEKLKPARKKKVLRARRWLRKEGMR